MEKNTEKKKIEKELKKIIGLQEEVIIVSSVSDFIEQ